MKALNSGDIYRKFGIFLCYFSVLLILTVLCRFFYIKTSDRFAAIVNIKKQESDLISQKRHALTVKMDSINNYMKILNTQQVKNDAALERTILKMKYDAIEDLEALESKGVKDFVIYRKALANLELMLDAKKSLNTAVLEEEATKKKLMDCNKANEKLKNTTFN